MLIISAKNYLLWEEKQLAKGGDIQSFSLLVESLSQIDHYDLNLIRINPASDLHLKVNLKLIESIWERHLFTCEPIQYLSGFTFWRDLKLKVSKKVLIPRPETELIIDIIHKIFKNSSKKIFFAELGTGSGAISIS